MIIVFFFKHSLYPSFLVSIYYFHNQEKGMNNYFLIPKNYFNPR